jgi:hypothetical protein
MKTSFKTLIIGSVAFVAAALATPAQAHDRHHHNYQWGRHHERVIIYGGPHYYPYRYYPPAYSYYEPYGPSYYGPRVTFAFGGHHLRHHPHWR